MPLRARYGRLAQLVELPLDVRKVRDSSSLLSTMLKKHRKPDGFGVFLHLQDFLKSMEFVMKSA